MEDNASGGSQQIDNQPSPNSQTLPTPNIGQGNVTPPQTAQPSFQQPSGIATAGVVTNQASTGGETSDRKESKLKYVAYFLLGLFLSILGFLIGTILILAKEKQNRLRKLIPLLLGVVMSIVVAFILVGGVTFEGTTTTSTIYNNQPQSIEEKEMVADLLKLYPNSSFKILYGEHKPPLTIGDTTISTFVTVELSSDENVTPVQIAEVGKQVCTTLSRLQLSVSSVEVQNVSKKSVISSSSRGIGGTCEEYNLGKILETLQSM